MNAGLAELRPIVVLLAEDDPDDLALTRLMIKRTRLAVDLHHVENGRDCLEFLRRIGRFADAPRPDLVLLDVRMPILDGCGVLTEMARDPALRALPVIVLTRPDEGEAMLKWPGLPRYAYVPKPVEFDRLIAAVRATTDCWFAIVAPPVADS